MCRSIIISIYSEEELREIFDRVSDHATARYSLFRRYAPGRPAGDPKERAISAGSDALCLETVSR